MRPGSELLQEDSWVVGRSVDDLATEEAVLESQVAFDVHEAEHPVWGALRQYERRESAHRVTDDVELLDR